MAAGRSRETGIEPVPFFLPEMRIFGSGEQGTQAGGNTGLAESPGGRASFNGKGNPEVMEFADPLIIMFKQGKGLKRDIPAYFLQLFAYLPQLCPAIPPP